MDTEYFARLALSLADGIGPGRFWRILRHFGSAVAALDVPRESWQAAGLGAVHPGAPQQLFDRAHTVTQDSLSQGLRILHYGAPDYPAIPHAIALAPPALWIRGQIPPSFLWHGIVGTRRPGPEATSKCLQVLESLPQPAGIVSGLAFGIDRMAHRLSLDRGLPNIAILGHSLEYPLDAEGTALARDILQNGALLSHFPPKTPPSKGTFPARNAVIVALSQSLTLVESQWRGGGMITAQLAHRHNCPLFAVPGPRHEPFCDGPNALLDHGYARSWTNTSASIPLEPPEQHVALIRACADGRSAEELARISSMPLPQCLAILAILESDGWIAALPGQRYRCLLPH